MLAETRRWGVRSAEELPRLTASLLAEGHNSQRDSSGQRPNPSWNFQAFAMERAKRCGRRDSVARWRRKLQDGGGGRRDVQELHLQPPVAVPAGALEAEGGV